MRRGNNRREWRRLQTTSTAPTGRNELVVLEELVLVELLLGEEDREELQLGAEIARRGLGW